MTDILIRLIDFLPFIFMVIISLPFHEFAHGYIANKLGDDTAYYQGRLTLNPLAHLDLFGTLSMIFVCFGLSKPFPVKPRRFKCNMRLGMALTALAGPLSNILLALVFMIVTKGTYLLGEATGNNFFYFLNWLTFNIMYTNISLAFFNLLPLPSLDGSRILSYFLPYKVQAFYDNLERYSSYILIGAVLLNRATGILSIIIGFFSNAVYWLLDKMTSFMGEAGYVPISYLLDLV